MAAFYSVWIFLVNIVPLSARLSFLLNGENIPNLPAEEPLTVIEGDRFMLKCESDYKKMTLKWRRDGLIITNNNTVVIEPIYKNYSGTYECVGSGDNRIELKSINVEVLFPPSNPIIEGETTGIYGEEVTLKCSSEGFPVPSYEWRRENESGLVLSLSQSLQKVIEEELVAIFCVVESVMNTTLGKSKIGRATRNIVIHGNKKAKIQGICNLNDNNVIEGGDIYIFCITVGKPAPEVWWTKVENNSFVVDGSRLVEQHVDKTFTGDYICHARNTVLSVNKTSITTEVSTSVSIEVTRSQPSKTTSSLSSKDIALISGNIVGWTIAITMITVLIALHVKRKRRNNIHNQRPQDGRIEEHEYCYIQNMTDSYISQCRVPEQIIEDKTSQRLCDINGQEAGGINKQNSQYLQPTYTLN